MGASPSIPRDRSRQLEVIGAGYGRTGTSAISMALEKLLDGPVMHGGTQILAREDGTFVPTKNYTPNALIPHTHPNNIIPALLSTPPTNG